MTSERLTWLVLGIAGIALYSMIAPSCSARTGDIEGQVLGMRTVEEQPERLQGATVLIAGNRIDCDRRSDSCVGYTDSAGRYRFDDVPEGDYGLSFVYDDPAFAKGKPLGSQARQINVSKGDVETASVVLLPEGVEPPPVPADLEQRIAGGGGYAGGYGGLTSNPFFWLWLMDRPYMFGYPRPPIVTTRPMGGPVTIDPSQPRTPARAGRSYSSYAPDGRGNAKAPPRRIDSRGVVRPGAAPIGGAAGRARASSSSSTTRSSATSRGRTRPAPKVRAPSRIRVPRIRAPSRGFGGFRGGGFRRCCTLGCCVGEYILVPQPVAPDIAVPRR